MLQGVLLLLLPEGLHDIGTYIYTYSVAELRAQQTIHEWYLCIIDITGPAEYHWLTYASCTGYLCIMLLVSSFS